MVGSTQLRSLRNLWHRRFGHGEGPYLFAGWNVKPYCHYLQCQKCEGRGMKGLQKIVYTRRPCFCHVSNAYELLNRQPKNWKGFGPSLEDEEDLTRRGLSTKKCPDGTLHERLVKRTTRGYQGPYDTTDTVLGCRKCPVVWVETEKRTWKRQYVRDTMEGTKP